MPSIKDLGIRTDNIKRASISYLTFTIFAVLILIAIAKIFHKETLTNWWTYSALQWVFIPISLLQEFIFRSLIQTSLQKFLPASKAIVITALLFSLMHILWMDPLIMVLAFLGGLIWGYLWFKFPNLILITISHAVINFTIIYLGFFPWTITDLIKF